MEKNHSLGSSSVCSDGVSGFSQAGQLVVDPAAGEFSPGPVLGVEEIGVDSIGNFLVEALLESFAGNVDLSILIVGFHEGHEARGSVDGSEFEVGDVQSTQPGCLVEGVSCEERDVLVVSSIELALLVHLALRGLNVKLGVFTHHIATSVEEAYGIWNMGKHILCNNGVEVFRSRQVAKVFHSPETDDSFVALFDRNRYNVGSRVNSVGVPSNCLEFVQLASIVRGDLENFTIGRMVALLGDLVRKPFEILSKGLTGSRLVEILAKEVRAIDYGR
mmetsp:Transcript_3727/g.6923  ORF Transcript_3727/g.6923 Transcript_3727/m.6923 type:complete len:275 (-) Transcript_3727:816-1640(-)